MLNKSIIILCIAVLITAAVSFVFIDLPLAVWLHANRIYLVKSIFETITFFGRSELYLIPTAVFFIIFRKSRQKSAQKSLFMFSTVAASGILVDIIKVIAGRFRPVLYFNRGLFGFDFFHIDSDHLSFPSGHSATAMSIMVALGKLFPEFRYLFYATGVIIALSRAVITAHYLSDVITGALIGVLTSVLLYNRFFKERIDLK
ncbi:MAG: phosphatase PAP2 family protein [Deltaproteobacteria bacterium]|nr:phosphatase PAP2 family protein [Deltaproteobacteria bacterium]